MRLGKSMPKATTRFMWRKSPPMIWCWTPGFSLILIRRSPVDPHALMVWLSNEITIAKRRLARVACFNQHAIQHFVAGEPRLRVLHQVLILKGCRDSRGHLNSDVMPLL